MIAIKTALGLINWKIIILKNFAGFFISFSPDLLLKAILKAIYIKKPDPSIFKISWNTGNLLKIIAKPELTAIKTIGNPNVTPYINGRVFFIPKLKPEYEANKLFGPGEKAPTNKKIASAGISGYIII